jgi:mannitol/fructose-specific phosphotransferase system IIA component (Ntr-type)
MPRFLSRLDASGIPRVSVVVTLVLVLGCIVLFDPTGLAKLASAFQLLMFALVCGAVIVMRESGIQSYDPSYRSPFYPYMQIIGILSAFFLLAQMGWLPQVFTFALVGFSLVWYFKYAKPRVERPGALLHVFERLGRERTGELDVELRGILKEKGIRKGDPFDPVVRSAGFIDVRRDQSFEELTALAARHLEGVIPESAEWIAHQFLEGTRIGATPVARGVALPHCRHPDLQEPHMVVLRVARGVSADSPDGIWAERVRSEPVYAIFYLASPEADPAQHLRMLAKIASHAEDPEFMSRFLSASDELQVKVLLTDGSSPQRESEPPEALPSTE